MQLKNFSLIFVVFRGLLVIIIIIIIITMYWAQSISIESKICHSAICPTFVTFPLIVNEMATIRIPKSFQKNKNQNCHSVRAILQSFDLLTHLKKIY